MSSFYEQLKEFVSFQSVPGDKAGNSAAVDFLVNKLIKLGFRVSTEGSSFQPVIVAIFESQDSISKVVLYNHYDVESVSNEEIWETNPFELTQKDSRFFGRGIADNKGTLLARLLAMEELKNSKSVMPNILWLIQGEEECAGEEPFGIFANQMASFGATIHLEETGYQKDGHPLILFLPIAEDTPKQLESLNETVFGGLAVFENRALNKFNRCPFISNIPPHGIYIAFGPNDVLSRVHASNESLDINLLLKHVVYFKNFIRWIVGIQTKSGI